jgi:hypothetical protein
MSTREKNKAISLTIFLLMLVTYLIGMLAV